MLKNKLIFTLLMYFFALNTYAVDLDAIRNKYQLPSLGAAVINKSTVQNSISGIRKWGNPTPANENDVYHLGSDTKAMTATLIALYVERGFLNWNTRLVDIFPELAQQMHPDFRNVTVEMLTSHRSGIGENFNDGGVLWSKLWDPNLDVRDGRKLVTSTVLSAEPAHKPGSFEYSNYNYIIAGAILEKLSGKSWEQLMQDELFTPLGMTSCGFGAAGDPNANSPDQPWPHNIENGQPKPVTPGFYGDNPPTLGPAGTVHCAMNDWARFLKLHIDGFNGRKTPLLHKQSFQKLHAVYPGGDYTYGGWIRTRVNGLVALTHAGSNGMNYAVTWLFPQKDWGVLSVTNIGQDRAAKATDEVVYELLQENHIYSAVPR